MCSKLSTFENVFYADLKAFRGFDLISIRQTNNQGWDDSFIDKIALVFMFCL